MPLPVAKHATKPLDFFIEELNSRKIEIDDGIRELCNSIVANGLLQPLIAMDTGHLLAGFRRLAAMKLANELGLAKIESAMAQIYPASLTPSQRRIINLTENVQRTDLSPPEIYLSVSELLKLNEGMPRKDLAEHLGKSQATITQWLSPDDLIPEAKQAFLDGRFGFGKAYAIAKLKPDEQSGLLALTLSGATRDHLERQGRRTRSASTAAVRASKLVICLANEVRVTISGADLSLEEAIDAVKDAQREMVRGRDQGLDMRTLAAVTRDKAKAGA